MNTQAPSDSWLAFNLLLAVTLKGTLLLALAGMLALTMKRAAAATRHFLWFASLTAVLLLPFLSFLPSWNGPAWAAPATQSIERLNQVAISAIVRSHRTQKQEASLPVTSTRLEQPLDGVGSVELAKRVSRIGWPEMLLMVWATGAIAYGAWWLTGPLLLRRIAKASRPASHAHWEELVRQLSGELGLHSQVKLLVAEGPFMPMTWGWRKPVVLLPAVASNWTAERLELVLHHELAHIRRRDYMAQSIVGLTCALQWFNPLVWHAARRMRAERELACDDLVLSSGASPSTYAGHLLDIALQFRNRPVSVSLPMARSCKLEQRLRAVVDEHRKRGGLSHAFAVTFAAMVILFVCLVGAGAMSAAFISSSGAKNNIPPHLKKFFAEKERLARVLEERTKANHYVEFGNLPVNVWAFFSAGAQGDWSTMTNAYAQLRSDNPLHGGTNISLRGPAFQAIMEAYGAYEQFSLAGEKYAQKFTRDALDSLPTNCVYFGGTDPGRFLITSAVKSQSDGDPCFVLTQNALADGTYLEYLRVVYANRLAIPTPGDSQRCFQEYLQGAQRRLDEGKLLAGENVKREDNRVTVSGVVAVMQINALLAKVIFDKNPSREFYIEENFPLDWMYPHLSPDGLILKLNRHPLPGLDNKAIQRDQQYWITQCNGMIGGWLRPETSVTEVCGFATNVFAQGNLSRFKGDSEFVRNQHACMPFAKTRAAIAGVYQWRMEHAADVSEKARMADAADFAYRQAFALCPYSPEAASRYARFLIVRHRPADAQLVAKTAVASKPEGETGKALQKALDEVEGLK